MKRGLRLRLALTHALVALLAIVVVAVIVFVAGGRRFDTYLSEVQRSRNEAVVNALTQTYKAPDGWDAASIYALSQIALPQQRRRRRVLARGAAPLHRAGPAHGQGHDGRRHDGRRQRDDGRRAAPPAPRPPRRPHR